MPAPPPPPPALNKNATHKGTAPPTNSTNFSKNNASPGDRSALLLQIQKGKNLKHVRTVQDRSAPLAATGNANTTTARKNSAQTLAVDPPTNSANRGSNGKRNRSPTNSTTRKSPANSSSPSSDGSPAKSPHQDQLCMRDLKSMLETKMRFTPNGNAPRLSPAKAPSPSSASVPKPVPKTVASRNHVTPTTWSPTNHDPAPILLQAYHTNGPSPLWSPSVAKIDVGARASKFATLGRRPAPSELREGGDRAPPPLPKKPPTLRRMTRPPPFNGPAQPTPTTSHLPASNSTLSLNMAAKSGNQSVPASNLLGSGSVPPLLPARNRSLINLALPHGLDGQELRSESNVPPALDRTTKCSLGLNLKPYDQRDETPCGVKNYGSQTLRPDLNRSLSITALPHANHKGLPVPPTPSRRQPLPDFSPHSQANLTRPPPPCNGSTPNALTPGSRQQHFVQSLADEFERRFPFNAANELPRPHYYSKGTKLYPSKSAASKQKQRARPPPPPPAPRV